MLLIKRENLHFELFVKIGKIQPVCAPSTYFTAVKNVLKSVLQFGRNSDCTMFSADFTYLIFEHLKTLLNE